MNKLYKFLTLSLIFLVYTSVVSAHSEVVVIKMTAEGFKPNDITIDKNSTINFINEDKVDHWPASDLHPTHEIYPEFDPKEPIAPGKLWLFKPIKVGTWKFHDHQFPHFRGTLTVTQEAGIITQIISPSPTTQEILPQPKKGISVYIKEFFQKTFTHFFSGILRVFGVSPAPSPSPEALGSVSNNKFKSLTPNEQFTELKSLSDTKGSEVAWQFILDTYKDVGGTTGNVHDLAHLSGQLLFTELGFPALSKCTTQFAFGCFHGFLDAAFKTNIDNLSEAEKACQAQGSGISGPVASCIHGIGHGIASFFKTDDLKDALNSCDRLNELNRQYCYDGVFMEFERNAPDTFYKSDQLLYPCDGLEERFVFSCGRNQPQVLLQRFKKNFVEVVNICESAQNQIFKSACFDALGFIAAAQGKGIPQQIVGLCQQITSSKNKNSCLRAAAGEVVFQEMPNWYETSSQICAASDADARNDCQGYVQHLIEDYGRLRQQSNGEDNSTWLTSQMKICLQLGGRDECYKKLAELLSQKNNLKQSLVLLKTNEDVPAVYARCHELTHYLSRKEYEKQKSVPQVYAQCDSTCHGGCYHGTLEAYLKENQIALGNSQMGEKISTICGKPADYQNLLVFYECLHGLGHAAMFISDMEIPDSLALCDALASVEYRERCYSGVFMENSSSSTSTDHPGKYVKADDPMYPCNILDEKYQRLCYRYQSSYFAIISNQQWQAVAGLCLRVPSQYQKDCFRTIGTNQVGFTSSPSLMRENCESMPDQFKDTCFGGVIGSFAYRFVGDITKMAEFCSSLAPMHQPLCFRNIGTSVVDWSPDKNTQISHCQKVSQSTQFGWCVEGIDSNKTTADSSP